VSVPDSSLVADGRRRRSERTRLAIIEAYLELLRQNLQMPTAAHLADQAGCSVRSIFMRFASPLRTTPSPKARQRQWPAISTATGLLAFSPTSRPAAGLRRMAAPVAHYHEPGSGRRTRGARRPGAPRQHRENEADVPAGTLAPSRAGARAAADRVGRADQLRELGSDAPLPRPFDRGRAGRLAVCHRSNAAVGWITP
jgi:hypothetical protein